MDRQIELAMRSPDFWYPQDFAETGTGVAARILPVALCPGSMLYNALGQARRALTKPLRADVKVICIGNLTVGGTGKTPTAIAVARQLTDRHNTPFFLTRGFGGRAAGPLAVDPSRHTSRQVGDESLLLARHAPTIVSHNRLKGAELAVEQGADIIVMDDGFQNPTLVQDLSIIVVDAQRGFGNGRIIPAGPLREPITKGLARAHAIVLMQIDDDRSNWITPDPLQNFRRPLINAWYQTWQPATLESERVFAFAGIGRPQKFFQSAAKLGLHIVDTMAYPDHHAFTSSEFGIMVDRAETYGACLLTTEKDFVRLTKQQQDLVHVLKGETCFENSAQLDQLLADRAFSSEVDTGSR